MDAPEQEKQEKAPQPGDFVPIPGSQKRPPTASEGPAENVNLVSYFAEDELKAMAVKCVTDYDADVRSRSARMKKLKEFNELYIGLVKAKSFPFNNAANINLPILTYPMLQVQARLFDMVWPDNGKVFYSAPSDLNDRPRAQATEKFGNSYIRHKMPEMGVGIDDTLAQVCAFGSAFRRTYWDSHEGRVRSDWIPIEDFVVAHWQRSQDPSMRDVPRMTLVHHMTLFELEMYADSQVFVNVEKLRAGDEAEHQRSELAESADRADGVEKGTDTTEEDKPRFVLEQHRMWRMPKRPGHPACDGKPHHVIVTIDEATKTVLRFVLREEDDPEDVARFTRQALARQQWQTMMAARQQDMQAAQLAQAVVQERTGAPPSVDFQQAVMPAPPEPPQPMPIRKRGIAFFTHYRAFPSEGFYGLGFGDFLAPLAKACNSLLNQHIDGVTFRNAKPGFISRQLKIQRGNVYVQPGTLVEVDGPTSAMKDGIMWLDPPQNDPTTMPLVQFLVGMADKVAGSSDIMSGSTSGANRTAKEIQILNSQLMKQISVLARRVKEAFKHELDKIWRCWGVFLPDQPEDMNVVGEGGSPETVPISRQMFIPDARVTPACDPRMKFEQRDESQQLFGFIMSSPVTATNPNVMMAATQNVLRTFDAFDILAALQMPVPPPPPGMGPPPGPGGPPGPHGPGGPPPGPPKGPPGPPQGAQAGE